MNKSRKKRVSATAKEGVGTVQAVTYGVIGGLITAVLCCIASATVCTLSSNPDRLTAPLATVSCILAHFVAGFISAKKHPAALPSGIASGGCLALIFWIVSLCFGGSYSGGLGTAVKLLIRLLTVAVSLVGALIGVNVGTPKRHRRR